MKRPRRIPTALWIAGGIAAALLLGRNAAQAAVAYASSCGYPAGPPPLQKSQLDLVTRIHARIAQANPALDTYNCGAARSCAWTVAGALAQADAWHLPVDLVTAIAWRESSFNPYVDNMTQRITTGKAIGPLQVLPSTFADVGMDAHQLIGMPTPAQIQYATSAGIKYLAKLHQTYLAGDSWCAVINAYNVGPAAYRSGSRNPGYTTDIVTKANAYTELRTT